MNVKARIQLFFLLFTVASFLICEQLNAQKDLTYTLDPRTGVITTSGNNQDRSTPKNENINMKIDNLSHLPADSQILTETPGTKTVDASNGNKTFTLDPRTGLITPVERF